MNIRLHIDRLVLEGLDVPSASRAALGAALEQELARLIAAGGLAPWLAGGTAVPSMDAPPIDAPGSPHQLGTAIAGALYAGMGGARR